MPIPIQNLNGLSTAAANSTLTNAPQITLAEMSPPGPSPSEVLAKGNPANSLSIVRVPLDTPMYYMQLDINKYNRASWREVGNLNIESSIVFPFPQTMVDNQNTQYEIQPLGFAGGLGLDAVAGAMNSQSLIEGLKKSIPNLSSAAGDMIKRAAAGLPGSTAVLGAAGIALNDFMTVMLRGPQYARRDFIWKFSPRSPQESESLRLAVNMLKNAQAPGWIGNHSAFFGWPRIFKIKFKYGQNDSIDMGIRTFKMKPAVLIDASYNYTPAGTWAAYGKTKMPEGIEIRLNFLELEYWINSSRDAQDAFGPTAPINTTPPTGHFPGGTNDPGGSIDGNNGPQVP